MALEAIGEINGHPIRWDRRTGLVEVKFYGMFSSSWEAVRARAYTIEAAFELARAYLRRR